MALVGVAVALGKRALGAKWGAVAALVVVVVYTFLVGAGASLAFAAILMTLINPYTLWDAGFIRREIRE